MNTNIVTSFELLDTEGDIDGKMKRNKWKYGLMDIAVSANLGIHKVRKDRAKKLFDPNDLMSVSKYIVKHGVL